jgi:hypothetical protein
MKTAFRTAALVSFVTLAVTLFAAISASGQAEAARDFDPMAAYPAAKLAASKITSNVTAISLSATRNAQASSSTSGCASFTWVWTVVGQDGVFVDVAVSPSGVKVLNHESRMILADQSLFDPAKVTIKGNDVLAIAMRAVQSSQPTDLYLGASLVTSGASELRWSVGFEHSEMGVDGDSGDVLLN